ncbi:MAG: chromosome segregation protein SMC [Pegethrix bostrychoides GSE-TBD4-15B]|uniref:Chromosome partition protein Smc n=1 Tax=Pegethrix bostrychoides GSE-TBD4-15B TaxID=2839662 RepID=A0A951U7Y1_9CYAN|nr:chromosome segregation protein SMC [Pegethrix bostrychoides GSE-TBD4-15B]
MYIKRVELTNFKSFGGTTDVPLLPGFTVISGPNGSGKSNILDALLFALGLSSSKGMRAERLPDLVNQTQSGRGRSVVEASVTATFALEAGDIQQMLEDSEQEAAETADFEANHLERATEWTVMRKLRVTQQGTYTSNYYLNAQPCTLTELHEQLQKVHVYPEGYNVVLQGDVTSIISMNSRERREIIDELAGVAAFDRKIDQAKGKLDAVKEREERFRIVERELTTQRDKLSQDRIKAERYQRLKLELQNKSQWEAVLGWQTQAKQAEQLQLQIAAGDQTTVELAERLTAMAEEIKQATILLDRLNRHVKALGEDELLALQASLATREAELRQLQRQQQELANARQETAKSLERSQQDIQEYLRQMEALGRDKQRAESEDLFKLKAERDQAQQALEQQREAANAIASASDAWVQEQTALRREIEALQATLEPQRTEQARLQERTSQLKLKIQEQTNALTTVTGEIAAQQRQRSQVEAQVIGSIQAISQQEQSLSASERELQVQQDTQARLLTEQRDKHRQLDKLEAQAQIIRESQGTGLSKILAEAGLPGICGLVAELGRVDAQYQLALEIAAGARLSYLIVEDDSIAAAGIELLKRQRAGRATFLPLNKIRASSPANLPKWNRPEGFIDQASSLIDCDDRYREVFSYVFGNTVVFANLQSARRQMGQYRIVTLDGELLETSGAMTGGSLANRQGTLHFGRVEAGESAEAVTLRERLQEIAQVLQHCERQIAKAVVEVKEKAQALSEARQSQRSVQLQIEQLQKELMSLIAQEGQIRAQLGQNQQELATAEARLVALERDLPRQEALLAQQRQAMTALEASQTHSEWQQLQAGIRQQEAQLAQRQLTLQAAEQHLRDLEMQRQRFQEKIEQAQQRIQEQRARQTGQLTQSADLQAQAVQLTEQIATTQTALAALDQTLSAEKQERDRAERQLREQQTAYQQLEWQRQKLVETQQTRRQELVTLQAQLATQRAELPDPLPEIPEGTDLAALQHELRSMQKRLQAMEPVNMLALEEYEKTQARLAELSQKLTTLDEERTELLLRIENFTTLRQRAFKEAFDAVNENFQTIFAELSDGDGYLQLDDPQDPFAGGLNLVAHPKGKPVRRLASMSGGEKSLTALSFIFALQRYRPSPFYAFDEVDMFLDGANVERLARMIKHQAQQAQFIVVSLRRPMIESAERTIGVTQARGAYTQVLGLTLQQGASG